MADIELIIKIPEHYYENNIKKELPICLSEDNIVAILPKGHGRLGDLDALETEMVNGIHAGNFEEGYEEYGHIFDMDDCVDYVRYADTIIKADKEESGGE